MKISNILCTLAAIFILNSSNAQTFSPVANGTNSDIYALAVYNSQLWIGGEFTECYSSDTIISPMLTIFDGSNFNLPTDSGWSGGGITNFLVNTTNLFIGGYFSLPFDSITDINNLVKYNGTWGDTAYSLNNTVDAMIYYNGNLYAGGAFNSTDSGAVNYIAKWDSVNHVWANVTTGVTNGEVRALEVFNGYLYAAGNFTLIDGVPTNYIAKWNDTLWQPIGLGLIGNVNALKVFDTLLYAGGNFILAGADTFNHIAAIDANNNYFKVGYGHSVNGLDSTGIGSDTLADVRCFEVLNGSLYIGGYFSEANGAPGNSIINWNGSNYISMGNGITSFGGVVYALKGWNGSLYIGGSFDQADSIAANNICKYDAPAGIKNVRNNIAVSTFPNPANTVINFNIINENNISGIIKLLDISGREMIQESFHVGLNSLDISNLDNGMYLYEIIGNSSIFQGKIIVEK